MIPRACTAGAEIRRYRYLLKPCSQKEMEGALLRACQAVDRQRKKVLYLYEERRPAHQIAGRQLQCLAGERGGC